MVTDPETLHVQRICRKKKQCNFDKRIELKKKEIIKVSKKKKVFDMWKTTEREK